MFEKWDDFENRPSCKAYSPCKAYSLCKMVSLGQKLKMPKTCEKPFYNSIRVALCKKTNRKTPSIGEMRRPWKSAICKAYSTCKGYSLCKMVNLGQKLKIPKKCLNFSTWTLLLLCGKKPFEKTSNIQEIRRFWKSAILQRL